MKSKKSKVSASVLTIPALYDLSVAAKIFRRTPRAGEYWIDTGTASYTDLQGVSDQFANLWLKGGNLVYFVDVTVGMVATYHYLGWYPQELMSNDGPQKMTVSWNELILFSSEEGSVNHGETIRWEFFADSAIEASEKYEKQFGVSPNQHVRLFKEVKLNFSMPGH